MKEYLKKNYVFVLALCAAILTAIGIFASFVSAKAVSVTPVDSWYEVTKIAGRSGLNIFDIAKNGASAFIVVIYALVIIGIATIVLGKYVHKNFLICGTLIFITTGVIFLLSNSLYELGLCYSYANEPNLYEELHERYDFTIPTTDIGDMNAEAEKLTYRLAMEKYNSEKWNEFFYDHIADKIRLYESKLCKDVIRDAFHNPFLLEDNANDEEIYAAALELENVKKYIEGNEIKKHFVIKGRVVNKYLFKES